MPDKDDDKISDDFLIHVDIKNRLVVFAGEVCEKSIFQLKNKILDLVSNHLKRAQSQRDITIEIQSNGGCLFSGFAFHDTMCSMKKKFDFTITAVASGLVASSASLMWLCGDKRLMQPNAYLLVHQIQSTADEVNNYNKLIEAYRGDRYLMRCLKKFYKKKTGISDAYLAKLMTRDVYISRKLALKHEILCAADDDDNYDSDYEIDNDYTSENNVSEGSSGDDKSDKSGKNV